MAKESKEYEVIFAGSGYQILRMNPMNVILETINWQGDRRFEGYFSTIEQALHCVVSRDLLVDETQKLEANSYLEHVQQVKAQIYADIEKHFEKESLEDLFN